MVHKTGLPQTGVDVDAFFAVTGNWGWFCRLGIDVTGVESEGTIEAAVARVGALRSLQPAPAVN